MKARRIRMLAPDFRERVFRLLRKVSKGHDGIVHHDRREILIDPKLKGREMVGVVMHEVIHVRCPDLSEECVLSLEETLLAAIDPYVEYK